MSSEKDLPVFPFVPDSMSRSSFRPFEHGDFPSDDDVQALIHLMWQDPETTFYYYHIKDSPIESTLLAQVNAGVIRADQMERRYFKHPKFDRDYIRIGPVPTDIKWDWKRKVVETGPEFWRTTLTLSAFARNELDTRHKIELEEHIRDARHRARYVFHAFLSYSTANTAEADLIYSKATTAGLRVFMAPKHLVPGDDFAEEIRASLEGSEEVWLLLSPQSARSEWVISEWGAAWVLRRAVVPILHRCEPSLLPDRLSRFQCVDLHRVDELITNRVQRLQSTGS